MEHVLQGTAEPGLPWVSPADYALNFILPKRKGDQSQISCITTEQDARVLFFLFVGTTGGVRSPPEFVIERGHRVHKIWLELQQGWEVWSTKTLHALAVFEAHHEVSGSTDKVSWRPVNQTSRRRWACEAAGVGRRWGCGGAPTGEEEEVVGMRQRRCGRWEGREEARRAEQQRSTTEERGGEGPWVLRRSGVAGQASGGLAGADRWARGRGRSNERCVDL